LSPRTFNCPSNPTRSKALRGRAKGRAEACRAGAVRAAGNDAMPPALACRGSQLPVDASPGMLARQRRAQSRIRALPARRRGAVRARLRLRDVRVRNGARWTRRDGRAFRYLSLTWDPDPGDDTSTVGYASLLRNRDGSTRVVHDRHVAAVLTRTMAARPLGRGVRAASGTVLSLGARPRTLRSVRRRPVTRAISSPRATSPGCRPNC
jgi:hypothetical protein